MPEQSVSNPETDRRPEKSLSILILTSETSMNLPKFKGNISLEQAIDDTEFDSEIVKSDKRPQSRS